MQESMFTINRTNAILEKREGRWFAKRTKHAMSFQLPLSILGFALMACGLCFLGSAGLASEDKLLSATQSIRGRIFLSSSSRNVPTTVSLTRTSGNLPARQDRTLGYDGAFSFEELTAGNYLLTIESPDVPTIARTVEIKESVTPKTIFLTVRLAGDGSATIQEMLKDDRNPSEQEDLSTSVSKKAFKAFQKATEESAKGNNADAIEYLKKAITEQPNYYEAYNNLGAQYQKLRRWDEAIDAFLRAVALRDRSIKPHVNLGNIYMNLHQPDSAIKHFQSVLAFDANSLPAHLGLGQAFFQKKEYDAAGEHLETATRLDPRATKQAFMLLIQIQVLTQRYERARYFVSAMAEFFPNDPAVLKFSQALNEPSGNPPATAQP
jgi:tetratricopeptide (TPR) repeat protein